MELCDMTLKEAFDIINKELIQYKGNDLTPAAAYIASHLFIDVVKGINYLHSQNPPIIHRDIKLSNILLTKGVNNILVKISDFGLTTAHIRNDDKSQSHTFNVGTRQYMAPEMKDNRKYNEKVDIYSLGVLLRIMFNIDAQRFLDVFSYKYKN